LSPITQIIESRLDEAALKELSYVEFLAELLGVETNARRERYLVTRTKLAHFPLRTPGLGKTHLAVGLGVKAIEHGCGVYFVKAHDLIEDLRRAHSEQRLDRRMRVYLSPNVLVVDEFGVWPYDRTAAMLLFALVSARYERGSLILTSNKGFAEWGEVLGDPVVATAILDRLLHYSHILNIRGKSYRLKEKKRASLFGRVTLPNTTTVSDQPGDKTDRGVGQS